jgi:GT2 family glycosyltransferase
VSSSKRAVFLSRKLRYKAREWLLHALTRTAFDTGGDPSRLLVAHLSDAQKEALQSSPSFHSELPSAVVVIPFRDKWFLTKACLESLELQEAFRHLAAVGKIRVMLVDNGSQEEATRLGLESYGARAPFQILRVDEPFNFSRLNNLALKVACEVGTDVGTEVESPTAPTSSAGKVASFAPEVVLFLNNDVAFKEHDALGKLLAAPSSAPSVGAVGCTLLYENGRVQHLFLAPGVKIVGAHPLRGQPWAPMVAWRERPWPVAAVTGAALAVRVRDFLAVGGFDEALATAYQDLDLCLKLQKRGLVNWALGDVVLTHFETATRKASHQTHEVALMYSRWGRFLVENPYYAKEFSRWSESPAYARGEGPYPWREYLLLP